MTDPIITIEPAEVTVEPGGQARIEVTVRNPSSIVESYRIEVLAETPGEGPAAWAETHPAELRVYPNEKGSAIVVFAPPAGLATASGRFPFGVRAVSTVPPGEAAAVAEGDLEIGRVFGLQATITPMTSSGRWRGDHVLRYTNWGNSPVRLHLAARDPDERLGFLLRPTDVDLALGATATARLTVRTRKPYLRGAQTRLPFEVTGEQDQPGLTPSAPVPGDPRRPVLNGALMQKPILSRGTAAIAGLAVVALAGALVLALKTPKKHPTFVSEGRPLAPTGVAAKALSGRTVQVSWNAVHNVEGYKVVKLSNGLPDQATKLDPDVLTYLTPALTPKTRYCFVVKAFRGARLEASSRPACAVTAAAPSPTSTASSASASAGSSGGGAASSASNSAGSSPATSPGGPSTGPTFGPKDWIVFVGDFVPDNSANAEQSVRQMAATLAVQDGLTVQVLHSTDYPKMLLAGSSVVVPFWGTYVGPYDLAQAQTFGTSCRSTYQLVCTAALPSPP